MVTWTDLSLLAVYFQSVHEPTGPSEGYLQLEELVKPLLGRHLHLSCGGCGLCERCARRDDEPCRFPDKAMASLEAYGVNVYQTTRSTKLKYINGQNTVTYFSLVLF